MVDSNELWKWPAYEILESVEITLDTLANDQIFIWKLTEMTKIWLDTLTTPCKSIFDHWWQAEFPDTNIGSNWGWKLIGGVKNTIDQLPHPLGNTVK